ncbi:hypothetical protein [Staphylococcus aureus]
MNAYSNASLLFFIYLLFIM